MKSMNKKLIGAGIGIIVLLASTAFAAAYFTRETLQPVAQNHVQPKQHPQAIASAAPTQPRCNDGNVLGYVAGGAVGGIAGNQVGKGSGNTAATIAGTLGGAYLGGQYIPLNNVTCRQ
jgi:uncharacterized protein YcfJ